MDGHTTTMRQGSVSAGTTRFTLLSIKAMLKSYISRPKRLASVKLCSGRTFVKKTISVICALCLAVLCLLGLIPTPEQNVYQPYCPVITDYVQHHTSGQMRAPSEQIYRTPRQTVGMVLALTTRGLSEENTPTMDKMPLLTSMLESFCKTSSNYYNYQFFISYDNNDTCMTQEPFLNGIRAHFIEITNYMCPVHSNYSIQFLQCNHSHHVAWAQNDAVVLAYESGVDFIYRINDDTIFESSGWTELFIQTLHNFDPPNVGVVGPNHKRGNLMCLTYEFVHRTHVDIFGFHYPRNFTDWDADVWLTSIYQPGRVIKIKNITLLHTMEFGMRYMRHSLQPKLLKELVNKYRGVIERYVGKVGQQILVGDTMRRIGT